MLTSMKESDPQKAGGLVSPSFADPGELSGKLTAMFDRKPMSIAITVR
jgi:hypothetical protein